MHPVSVELSWLASDAVLCNVLVYVRSGSSNQIKKKKKKSRYYS